MWSASSKRFSAIPVGNVRSCSFLVAITGGPEGIAPEDVATDLCGLAHVYFSLYPLPNRTLSRRLGSFGCYGGAIRVYWPNFSLTGDPFKHPLYTPARLRNWQGKPFRQSLGDRLFAIAASTYSSPAPFRKLRRDARRQELQATDIPEEWLDELERTEEERDRWEARAEELELEFDEATDEVARLKLAIGHMGAGAGGAAIEVSAAPDTPVSRPRR